MANADQLKIIPFRSPKHFEVWLEKHHHQSDGLWMRLFKKDSGKTTITYAEALDCALCYGWIDGQKKSLDALSWIQRFTPRRARSEWSRRNTEHVARLIKSRRMKPAGLKQIEAAKKDGRWGRAYDSPSKMTIPNDFMNELEKNKKAQTFFNSLNKSNQYAIGYRLQTAKKPETLMKRKKEILAMLARGEAFHSFKPKV
jgi:uncharacterized protein YdeI (YjbR/CyaY-like superfamily)